MRVSNMPTISLDEKVGIADNRTMDVQTLIESAGGVLRLASIAGVARTTVLDWRKTEFIPGSRIAAISAALELPPEDLLALVQPAKARDTAVATVAAD